MPRPQRAPGPQIRWERLPLARELPPARDWLLREASAGRAAATIDAYSRAVERYLAYCRDRRLRPSAATTEHVAAYLHELAAAGLGPAARQQRLTALRLFYAFVVERGLRPDNPAASAPGMPLLGREHEAEDQLPWIPDVDEWLGVLETASAERPRTRVMLGLAYDGALRREELCRLGIADVDLDRRLLRVRPPGAPDTGTDETDTAQTTEATGAGSGEAMGTSARVVPLSPIVAERCAAYLRARIGPGGRSGRPPPEAEAADGAGGAALFVSESPRNRSQPITIWTWSKVAQAIARRAGVERFTTHTPRHLRLTDLARAGRGAGEIARFAGHSRASLALRYLRLARERPGPAGRDVERRRAEQLARVLFRERR